MKSAMVLAVFCLAARTALPVFALPPPLDWPEISRYWGEASRSSELALVRQRIKQSRETELEPRQREELTEAVDPHHAQALSELSKCGQVESGLVSVGLVDGSNAVVTFEVRRVSKTSSGVYTYVYCTTKIDDRWILAKFYRLVIREIVE